MLRAIGAAPGLAVEGLTWVGIGDLGVWTSDADGDMLEHHRVVSTIHELVDCLPVRFPTRTDDPRPLIEAKAAELRAALEKVRGKTELALTYAWHEPVVKEPASSGREFMEKRRTYWTERRRREAAVRSWAEQLPPGAVVKLTPNDRVAASVALLVPRGSEPRLPELASARCVINGPWPPYSFATIE